MLLFFFKALAVCMLTTGFAHSVVDDQSELSLASLHLPHLSQESGLKRPLVTITFDDGWLSNYQNALPILQKYGYLATFYLNSGAIGNPGRFTEEQIRTLKSEGHEIGAHTVTHPYLSKLSPQDVEKELTESQRVLEQIIAAPVADFAAPFGDVSPAVISQIKKYFKSNRSVEDGYNSKKGFDAYMIKVKNIKSSTTPEEVEEWIDQAHKNKTWVVLVYHQVDDSGAPWGTTPKDIQQHIEAIQKRDLTVLTTEQALEEILPQLNIP